MQRVIIHLLRLTGHGICSSTRERFVKKRRITVKASGISVERCRSLSRRIFVSIIHSAEMKTEPSNKKASKKEELVKCIGRYAVVSSRYGGWSAAAMHCILNQKKSKQKKT